MSDEKREKAEEEGATRDTTCVKCEEYLNGWKRALADYDNLKKELTAQRAFMHQSVVERVGEQLIPILDNFDQALKFKPSGLDDKVESWLQGVLHVRTQLESVMREMGVDPFGSVGEAFDPYRHEAASQQEASESPSGIILEVIQRGWKRGEHILCPAKVIISK